LKGKNSILIFVNGDERCQKKYDGWVIKSKYCDILPWTFRYKRVDVIKKWNDNLLRDSSSCLKWKNIRRRGTHKIIKVKLLEIMD